MKKLILLFLILISIITMSVTIITPTTRSQWLTLAQNDTCILLPFEITPGNSLVSNYDEIIGVHYIIGSTKANCEAWLTGNNYKMCTQASLGLTWNKTEFQGIKYDLPHKLAFMIQDYKQNKSTLYVKNDNCMCFFANNR